MKKKKTPSLRPKKHLGQNFLTNQHIVDKIIASCALKKTDTVIEIGPGQGVLTYKIYPLVKKLIAVEKDVALYQKLCEEITSPSVTFYNEDFLKTHLAQFEKRIKIIGNLPYYISTPILTKLIKEKKYIKDVFITVQFEFGQRLVAKPGGKDYGSLSLFAQYHTCPTILFKIKNTSFYPQPKVQSCFVHLAPKEKTLLSTKQEEFLFTIIRYAFQQRRKTILNALSKKFSKEIILNTLCALELRPNLRPENLTLNNFIDIAEKLGS